MKPILKISGLYTLLGLAGCMSPVQVNHKVEPIKIEITVRVQVERDLEDFFGDIDNVPVE